MIVQFVFRNFESHIGPYYCDRSGNDHQAGCEPTAEIETDAETLFAGKFDSWHDEIMKIFFIEHR